jgi:UDP-N-acetylmuramoylalanine--D-glutamate ligase
MDAQDVIGPEANGPEANGAEPGGMEPGVGEPGGRWSGRAVCVAGLGVSGAAAARALAARGARVTVVDGGDGQAQRDGAAELSRESAGAEGSIEVRLGEGDSVPDGTDLVVTSPGWRPTAPLPTAAAARGIEVIGEVELAWLLRTARPGRAAPAPWLAVTGTNGKTTVVRMLERILAAAGLRGIAVGNVGEPVVDAVSGPYDVLAVELSSFQLHWSSSLAPYAAVVLNVAPDHLDWHGDLEAYAAAKARIFGPGTIAVANVDDPLSARLAMRAATRGIAGRVVSYTTRSAHPAPGQLGIAGAGAGAAAVLVDRAFGDPPDEMVELARATDVRPPTPHNISNALAAAALARAFGVAPQAVRAGLRSFTPDPHRVATVGSLAGVTYVDDSKATNPHAAAASLSAFQPVVWIAGGLLKGADVDDLVRGVAGRLRAAVLIGRDRAAIAEALARHAPNVPVVEVPEHDTGAMDRVVAEAARLARPGDTVLLAPAAASFDMFTSYGARGDAFAAAVVRRGARPEPVAAPASGPRPAPGAATDTR